MDANPWTPDVEDAINGASKRYGLAPSLLRAFAKIESSGRSNAQTGSYKGLFQLSNNEFGKYGGGDIFNPADNANAAAQKLANETASFKSKYGRDPAPADLYLVHQQGEGGYGAHVANPSAPAWQNMYSTAEGRQKGPGWAKQAIWGNVPADVRTQYPGGVDSLTSQQFLDLWKSKVDRIGGTGMPVRSNLAQRLGSGASGYIGGTAAAPAPVVPGAVPPEALVAPTGRYSKLADALMASAAGAKPKGWGDLLNATGDLALGYTLGNKEDQAQKTYSSKLSQMLGGATTPEAMTQALMTSGDPDLMKQAIIAKMKPEKAEIGRFRPSKQGIIDSTTGMPYHLDRASGKLVPGIDPNAASDGAEYGTSPQYYKDKDGKLRIGQLSKSGGMKPVDLDGEILPGIDYKDTGLAYQGFEKRTGAPVANIPKDVAAKEAQQEIGKLAGQASVGLPQAKTTVDETRINIKKLREHPGLDVGTGLSAVLDPRSWIQGTDAYDFMANNKQATAQSFMAARESLKGAGQVTDFEGAKGQDSISNLNTAQSKEQYLAALDTLDRMMQASYDNMLSKSQMAGSRGAGQAGPQLIPYGGDAVSIQGQPKRLKFNPATGELE